MLRHLPLTPDDEPIGAEAGAPPGAEHLPREARHVTILLVARLVDAAGIDHICRVRNISSGGLMLESGARLAAGQPIRIELREGQWVQGVVAWANHPKAGMAFDAPADLGALLQSTRSRTPRQQTPRSPRFRAECPVVVRCGGNIRPAALLDLSQRGAKLRATGLANGDQLKVSVPGAGTCPAVVRWVRQDEAGIVFLETISFADLDRWLEDPAVRFGARGH